MRLLSPSALRRARILLLVAASALACLSSRPQTLATKHVRPEVLTGRAQLLGPLDPAERLHLSLVLPLRNKPELDSLLQRLYDPASPGYHRFLTVAEFTRRFSPTSDDYNTLLAFARASGFTIDAEPPNRLILPVTASIAQIESAFHLRMNLYRHPAENRTFFSPDREPTLDAALPIAHIAGLNNYSFPHPLLRKPSTLQASATGSGPSGSYLASDMRAAYYGASTLTGAGQSIALVEFDGYHRSDVDLTFSSAGQSYSVPIENILLDGLDGSPLRGDDAEPVLDIAQAIGMAPGLASVRVYIGTSDASILNAIAADNLAQQISISWTWAPDDPDTDDEFFIEMAAQGQSVFAASGDTGQFDPANQDFYPAEDAYVTAVGGTHLVTAGSSGLWQSETAWAFSGGGVSPDSTPIPPWQTGVATAANNASTTLRNVPDVAAEADFDNYVCDLGACSGGWAGTSFAAPRWAAFIALANQQAALAGDPPIGFLNPALYTFAPSSAALHDIRSGNNNTGNNCCNAVPGYDLVTGWGTPAGQALIDALAPAPSLQLIANPATLNLNPGASASVIITIHSLSPATLTITGLPHGVAAAWSANPTSASTTLTLTAANSALRGSSLLTVSASTGSQTATTHIALKIDAPGFTLASPTLQFYPGASATAAIAITPYAGFTGKVHFAVTSALPAGVTAVWLDNPSATTAQLTLTAANSASASHTMLTITGICGSLTAVTHIALTLSPPQFVLNLSPYPLQLAEGESQSSTVTVIPIGNFNGSVSITAPQLPSGVTAALQPNSTAAASTLTLTASASAPTGHWPAAIQGKSSQTGSQTTSQAQFTQTITPPRTARFTLAASPAYARVTRGSSIPITVTLAALNGFASSVSLAASNLPNGVTASWSRNPATSSSILTLTASPTASTGPAQPIVLAGTSTALSSQAILYLTVDPAPSFSLSPQPASTVLPIGGSASVQIAALTQPGFTGSIAYSLVSALPQGITATLNPSSSAATLLLSADTTAAPASFHLLIEASSAGQTATASLPITVTPPPPAITTITPAFTAAGASSATIHLNGSAFTSASTLYWNGAPLPTHFLSSTQLAADLSSTHLAQPGIASITVRNGAAVSNTLQFEIDSDQPAGTPAPALTPASITLSASQSATYAVSLPAAASSASALCLNLPFHATCSYSGARLTITTAADTPSGAWPITVVFTETQTTTTAAATLLVPIFLLPYLFIRRKLAPRTIRLADFLCTAILAAAVLSACGSSNPAAAPSPTSTTHTFTSSAVVTLTVR